MITFSRQQLLAMVAFFGALLVGLVVVPPLPMGAQPASAPVRLTAPYRVTVGAAAVQLTTSGNVHGIVLECLCPGQTIYIGASAAVTTATGYPMADGETLTLEVRNANQLFAIASAAGQSLAVLPFSRY
jgi:hypothetical protein